MKKIISLILCLCFVFSFVGCNNSKDKKENLIDLEYFAKIGQIPEVKYTLGSDIDKVTKELSGLMPENIEESSDHSHDHNQTEFFFEVIEGEDNILLDNGTSGYYYNKDNKNKGVSYIVNYDKGFGFELGTVSVEIKKALENFKLKEESVNENNAFFADYISNGTVLKTEIDNVVIMFVFQDNELFATAMYDTNNWSF